MPNRLNISPLIIRLSKFISNFFNPLTSLILFLIYKNYRINDLNQAVKEIFPILLLIVIPLITWIYWNVKKGNYSNMDVSNRRQRNSLYIIIDILIAVYLLVYFLMNDRIDFTMFFLLILLILMQISNLFIKSSMHTSLNIFAAALFFSLSPMVGFIWLIIAIIVGITRIILKRHTPKEVIMGAFLGSLVSFFYLYVFIQNQQIL